jgi:voltage-gated potassium channel
MIKHFRNELILAVLLFLLLLLTGTLGYHWSQNYPWVDALYMTVITVTTVGFGEVYPLDEGGKLLTIFLILTSIVIYAYIITVITEYVVGENIIKKLIVRRMENKIKKLQNHVIIAGYGRTGKQAVNKLKNYNRRVVVIDMIKPENDRLIDFENVYFIEGDATKDDVLQKAGISVAASLITTLHTDADNLFVVLSARQMNPDLKIVSRATNEKTADKMKLAGANRIIMPEVIGGEFMASLVVTPDLVEFLNALSMEEAGHKTNLEEIHFNDLPEEYQGKTIAGLDLRRKTGCSIIGYKTPENQYIINPSAETKLEKGSAIIVLGQPEQIAALNRLFYIGNG